MKKTTALILIFTFIFTALFAATANANYDYQDEYRTFVIEEDIVISEYDEKYENYPVMINEGVTLTLNGDLYFYKIIVNGTLNIQNSTISVMSVVNNGRIIGSGDIVFDIFMGDYSGTGTVADGFQLTVNKFVDTVKEIKDFDSIRAGISQNVKITLYTYTSPVEINESTELPAELIDPENVALHINEGVCLTVDGSITVNSNWTIDGDIGVKGDLAINDNIALSGYMSWVDGSLTANGDLAVNGRMHVYGDLIVNGNLEVNGNVTVDGKLILNGKLSGKGNIFVVGAEGEGTIDAESTVEVYISLGSAKNEEELAATLASVSENPFAKYDNVSFDVGIENDIVIESDIVIPGNAGVYGNLINVEIAKGGSVINNGSFTFSGGSLTIDSGAELINNNYINLSRTATATLNGSYSGNGTIYLTIDEDKTPADKLPGFNTEGAEILIQTEVQQAGAYSIYGMEVRLPEVKEEIKEDPEVPGDMNGDSGIDNKDVVVLFRFASSYGGGEYDKKYDFNGDGEVNNKDVVALFREVSKK